MRYNHSISKKSNCYFLYVLSDHLLTHLFEVTYNVMHFKLGNFIYLFTLFLFFTYSLEVHEKDHFTTHSNTLNYFFILIYIYFRIKFTFHSFPPINLPHTQFLTQTHPPSPSLLSRCPAPSIGPCPQDRSQVGPVVGWPFSQSLFLPLGLHYL